MNCRAFHDFLQEYLDGERTRPSPGQGDPTPGRLAPEASGLDEHLRDCPGCRDLLLAARRLGEGLRLSVAPVPPEDLSERIVRQMAHAPRRRTRRLLSVVAAGALAASLMVGLALHQGARRQLGPEEPPPRAAGPNPLARSQPAPQPGPPVRLRDSVAEAGSAVASLTSRTADATVEQTRALLPAVRPEVEPFRFEGPAAPPTRPLLEAGEGVSEGLEPVARSARRAVGLLLRELPPGLEDSVPNLSPAPVSEARGDEGTAHP